MTAPDSRPVGRAVPALLPGDPAWLTTMTASKIAAVVGLSPWESRYSLWHRMAGTLAREAEKPQHRRGHYLEPAVALWWADQHPELLVEPSPSWQHHLNPRWVATPDRQVKSSTDTWSLEVKTAAADFEDWGPAGSDQIPAHYAAQCQWQMLCSGHTVTHLAALTAYLEFREYLLPASSLDQAYLADAATTFLDSLPGGPTPRRPDLDSHSATYQAVRAQHPTIDGETISVPDEIGARYRLAVPAAKAATDELVGAKTALLDAMGEARKAEHDGQPIARRQSGARGAVALYSTLPKDTS